MADKTKSPAGGRQGLGDQRHAITIEPVNGTSVGGAKKGTTPTTLREVARKLYANGYPPVVIKPNDKAPEFKGWQKKLYNDAQLQTIINNGYGDHGVGINCSHVAAIDIDIYDRELCEKISAVIESQFPGAFYRVGQEPKRLYIFKNTARFRKQFSRAYIDPILGTKNRIEILGDGQQFVAYGIHPKTGKPYEWFNGSPRYTPYDDLPELTQELIDTVNDYYDELAQADGWKLDGEAGVVSKMPSDPFAGHGQATDISEAEIIHYLKHIPPVDRDEWIAVGMGIYHQYDCWGDLDRGYRLFDRWSQRAPDKYVDAEDTNKVWESFCPAPGRPIKTFRAAINIAREKYNAPTPPKELRVKRNNTTNTNYHEGQYLCKPFAEIEEQELEWVWPEVIARGKLTLIGGNPDTNKTTLAISSAAIISDGDKWPANDSKAKKEHVIFVSAEDAPDDTLKPRLRAAGADMDYIHTIEYVNDIDEKGNPIKRPFSLSADLGLLENELQRLKPAAIFIDPLGAFFGNVDSHKNDEMRRAFFPLIELASRYRVALVGITHLNKASGYSSIHRFIGSIASIAQARIAYLVIRDDNDESRREMLLVKNNLAASREGFAFHVKSSDDDVPYIEFEPHRINKRADEALLKVKTTYSELNRCKSYLEGLLKFREMPANEIETRAIQSGFSKRTIQRAKKAASIDSKHGKDGQWYWHLPSDINDKDLFEGYQNNENS